MRFRVYIPHRNEVSKTRRKIYFAELRIDNDHKPVFRSLGTTDKRVADKRAEALFQQLQQEAAGVPTVKALTEWADQSLASLSESFLRDLQARKKSRATVRKYGLVLAKLFKECGWTTLRNVDAMGFDEWRVTAGRKPKTLHDYQWKFFDYDGSIPAAQQGQFKSFTDLGGHETFPSYDATTHLITAYVRSGVRSGVSYSAGLAYVYYPSGANAGQLQSVTLSVDGTDVSKALYEYYGASDAYGNLNDLMRVTQQQLSSGVMVSVGVTYYRYYLPGAGGGFAHGLRLALGPDGYAQMVAAGLDPTTATTAQVAVYADNVFRYDGATQAAQQEHASGGTQRFGFAYHAHHPSTNYNHWVTRTVETLADGSQNLVYTNFAGQVMLSVTRQGTDEWFAYNRYDSAGRLILVAHSSAVASYAESDPELVTLHAATGFIESYVYYPSNTGVGAAVGYLRYRRVQQGSAGTPILVNQYQYKSRTMGSTRIHLLWKEICYPKAGDSVTHLDCHIYTYTWQGSTLLIDQKTTTFPVVSSTENGSNSANATVESYDAYGYPAWAKDERGFLTNTQYDWGNGALLELIQDVDTSIVSGAPAGWTTPTGGGLNLVTDYTVDGQGRVTQVLGPVHSIDLGGTSTAVRRATWTVYQDALQEVWQGSGYYVPGTGASTLINPVSLSFMDSGGRVIDQIQATRASTSGALVATDSFPQSSWKAWTHQEYSSGSTLSQVNAYFAIPASGPGARGTNYNQTNYAYDRVQRLNRTQTPAKTINRVVYNTMGWVLEQWTGTNDNGATDSDPSGGSAPGNNMKQVQGNVYDGAAAGGDGNLTQQTLYVNATTTRVTNYSYDFRDRQTVIDGEIDFYQVNTYDNLDRVTQVDRYDTTASGHLIARTVTNFDSLGRVYQSLVYAVDPATGTVGNALTSNTWYDPSGNVVQVNQAGSALLQRTVYDGVSRPTTQYASLNSSTSYPYPVSVTSDTVFQQTETAYDAASNVILQTVRERFHNATGTGALTTPTGAQPQARVSFLANWPDPLGRTQYAGNYGTNGGTALTRPATAPASSATVLVTATAYNNQGLASQVTDPLGTVNQSAFDALGRVTQLLENVVSGGTGPDQNRETDYLYSPTGQISTLTVVNATTGNQVTQYLYGTTLFNSDIASNELLRTVIYPDNTGSAPDQVIMAYNRQNQMTVKQDQLSTVHQLAYDGLGRLSTDSVTTLGSGVNGAVRQIARTYEVRGMIQHVTSYAGATGGTVVNDVLMVYNTFMQLTGQYQAHGGAATTSSPAVTYTYANGSANTVRLTGLIYPSGRETYYDYGTGGGTNDRLSRVNALLDNDDSTSLAAYTYVGLGRIAQVAAAQPGTALTYIQQGMGNPSFGTGGDQYTGWDQFGRIVNQRWLYATTDVDRNFYGYDLASNRLWNKNTVQTTGQDEFYTYDGLYQVKTFQQGTLNTGHTGLTGTPVWEEDFTFDPTGNWTNYVTKLSGVTTLNQDRTSNKVNEIKTIAGSSSFIAQDAAGNITKAPAPPVWALAYTMVYDAWNRLVRVLDTASGSTVASFAYDGQNWRTTQTVGGTVTNYYYTSGWQIVEERVGSSTSPDRQYVWGLLGGIDNLVLRDRPAASERLYAMADALGSVTAITNASGTVEERYGYEAYGTPRFMDASFGSISSSAYDWNVLYASYKWDEETGYYQVRNRYLHPGLGRWLTRDPIGYRGGINLYAYVRNRSVNWVDAMGLASPPLNPPAKSMGTLEELFPALADKLDAFLKANKLPTNCCPDKSVIKKFVSTLDIKNPEDVEAIKELKLLAEEDIATLAGKEISGAGPADISDYLKAIIPVLTFYYAIEARQNCIQCLSTYADRANCSEYSACITICEGAKELFDLAGNTSDAVNK